MRHATALVRIAVAEYYSDEEAEDLSEGRLKGCGTTLSVTARRVTRSPNSARSSRRPYLDTHLASIAPDDDPWPA